MVFLVTSCSWQNHPGQLAFSMHVNRVPKKQVAVTKTVQKRRQRKYTQNTRTLAHLRHLMSSVALQNSNFSYWFEFAMYFTLKVQFLAVELKCESENVNWRRFSCSSALLLESEWSHSLEERRPTLGAPSRHWNGDGAIYNRKTWGALPPRLLVDSSPGLTSV